MSQTDQGNEPAIGASAPVHVGSTQPKIDVHCTLAKVILAAAE